MTLKSTLYINVVSYFYTSVNITDYFILITVACSDNHNTRIINSPLAYSLYSLQHKTLKTLTKSEEIKCDSMVNMQVLCPR